ncbi:MAG TPA: hypothetical protein VEC14_15975 [Reyranellaceae bacterium]|nr:hypothetical protein [Reyranellaceae bacterium]
MFSLFRQLSQGRRGVDLGGVDLFLIAAIIAVACMSAFRAIAAS